MPPPVRMAESGTRLLIVSADDYGLTEKVSRAILKAHRGGIVTSTSVLALAPAFEQSVALAGRGAPPGRRGPPGRGGRGPAAAQRGRDPHPGRPPRAGCGPVGASSSRCSPAGGSTRPTCAASSRPSSSGSRPPASRVDHLDTHQDLHRWPVVRDVVLDLAERHDDRARCASAAPSAHSPSGLAQRRLAHGVERRCRARGIAYPRGLGRQRRAGPTRPARHDPGPAPPGRDPGRVGRAGHPPGRPRRPRPGPLRLGLPLGRRAGRPHLGHRAPRGQGVRLRLGHLRRPADRRRAAPGGRPAAAPSRSTRPAPRRRAGLRDRRSRLGSAPGGGGPRLAGPGGCAGAPTSAVDPGCVGTDRWSRVAAGPSSTTRFAVRSADDVARQLGQMKGAVMKLGQMLSFVVDGLPPEAQAVAGPAAGRTCRRWPRAWPRRWCATSWGPIPTQLFARWDPVPVAAASIGQVHRAELADGRAGGGEGAVPRASTRPSAATWPTPAGWARCSRPGHAARRGRGRRWPTSWSTGWPTSSTTASRPPTSRPSPSATAAIPSCRCPTSWPSARPGGC